MGTVFVKTDKGHEEIDKRSQHINFKHRTALIMVDGVSAVDTLLGKIPGDGITLLEELLRDGFIALAHGKAPNNAAETIPVTTAAAKEGFELETAKRDAVKVIESLLGPGGESLALSIEGSTTRAEFVQHAERTRSIISQMAGARKAAEFWTKTGL